MAIEEIAKKAKHGENSLYPRMKLGFSAHGRRGPEEGRTKIVEVQEE